MNTTKLLLGFLLAFLLGALASYFDLPAPAPPTLLGACLIVAVTAGYITVDYWKETVRSPEPEKTKKHSPSEEKQSPSS